MKINNIPWQVEIVNQTRFRLSIKLVTQWIRGIQQGLELFALKDKELAKKLKKIYQLDPQLTVVLLSEKRIRILNAQYRKKDKSTDILSFSSEFALGELIFCPQVIKKQASRFDHTVKQEFCYMLVHGVLHLLGYDHELNQKEAKLMFGLQDQIFKSLSTDKT